MLGPVADPTYPPDVADALRTWLGERFGQPVVDAVAPTAIGTGFSTLIHFVQLAGEGLPEEWRAPLVVRIHQSVEQAAVARREAAIQTWCHDRGFPAPRVLMVFAPGELLPLPVQVMERAPGTTMLEAIMKAPWQAARMLERLADLQLQLHALPIDGWPEAKEAGLAARRLALVRRSLEQHDDPELRDALSRAERLLPELYAAERVPCHGDFHPLNVMVSSGRATVIDWTDAGLGDRHGDVARTYLLFHVAAIAATTRVEKAVLKASHGWLARRYRSAYERVQPLDPNRLRHWEALHLLHGWAQVLDAHREGSRAAERVPIDLVTWLRAEFERSVA
jgi:aminoglycoside phosphotransferase (APT) family kinase protein